MEIERKFLINSFPDDLPLIEEAVVYQGYISVNPIVRIRSKTSQKGTNYILCFKGKGRLVRQETEIEIDEHTFKELEKLLNAPMIRKDYKVYELPDGYNLECSLVDKGETTEFMFAEVEFETLEQANSYNPPEFLNNEVTLDGSYGMASYWVRKMQQL
ncbi:MAG: CYTH domain-containing protein [Oscillospiraceae bacterium]|jgi:CYTH domain-containing protein|nr:CYTH domain-containing protein [Oscillospiraceae bacterium]